ncbi:MAG TPA: ketoacyl-ACP synthase III [Xanthomonadaceae bacterium]|jgi:3-oxoacyl-[acyl-carrier-protein] synthase-3|nr:ketoacyl-ACP synthase III [Xanthomonadaceae bacterium]
MSMLGIQAIASYVPEGRASNAALAGRFELDEQFLKDKIGVLERAVKAPNEDTSDLAWLALERLIEQQGLDRASIQALVVVTQNPDRNIPHVSGQVHGRAGLAESCAAFDISLGCSGYVYGLAVLRSLMQAQGLDRGVLVTADPYSKIIDPDDRNTVLLFGDAATATLIGTDPVWTMEAFSLKSRGKDWSAIRTENGRFAMDGRSVFNFAATTVPGDINAMLAGAGVGPDDVDRYILHQGSRFIVKSIADRLRQPLDKFPIEIEHCGNTVSSTIPLIAQHLLADRMAKTVVLSGFGVGLSWASCLCRRTEKNDTE